MKYVEWCDTFKPMVHKRSKNEQSSLSGATRMCYNWNIGLMIDIYSVVIELAASIPMNCRVLDRIMQNIWKLWSALHAEDRDRNHQSAEVIIINLKSIHLYYWDCPLLCGHVVPEFLKKRMKLTGAALPVKRGFSALYWKPQYDNDWYVCLW